MVRIIKILLLFCFLSGCSFISDLFIKEVIVEKYYYLDIEDFPEIDTVFIPEDIPISVGFDSQGKVSLSIQDYRNLRYNYKNMKLSADKANRQIENYRDFVNWYINQEWNEKAD